ncbi:unnamed protein product [Microthlaspi erraticum]|uniref:Uncharacterized protein n=1 Tax=Microthlaspi erraticum TaxID=1685480 RepID=A0A6D2HDD2_9BRAS|nr:unnamed protein product [Microthlaspi erraticum]
MTELSAIGFRLPNLVQTVDVFATVARSVGAGAPVVGSVGAGASADALGLRLMRSVSDPVRTVGTAPVGADEVVPTGTEWFVPVMFEGFNPSELVETGIRAGAVGSIDFLTGFTQGF